jgi:hypothetical protein
MGYSSASTPNQFKTMLKNQSLAVLATLAIATLYQLRSTKKRVIIVQ